MKTLATFVILASYLAWIPAQAEQSDAAAPAQAKPTEESLHRLLALTEAKAMTEAVPAQMDAYFSSMLNKLLEGKPISAEQQQTIDNMRQKLNDMMKESLNWESLEPGYLEVYGKT